MKFARFQTVKKERQVNAFRHVKKLPARFARDRASAMRSTNTKVQTFFDIPNLIRPSSIRQAISDLKKPQPFVIIKGKNQPGTLLQSDEWAPVLNILKQDIQTIIAK